MSSFPSMSARFSSYSSSRASLASSSPALSRSSSSSSLSDTVISAKPAFANSTFDLGSQSPFSETPCVSKVCFVGAGYVGGPTAAIMAYANPNIQVTVVDKDTTRVQRWQSRHLPVHEPGLDRIVRIARDGACRKGEKEEREANFFFSTECERSIAEADIIFVSVNTPTKTAGVGAGAATNIAIFESAMRSVAVHARAGAIIVEKSTVPCRTAEALSMHRPGEPFEILSNPEFLAEGSAVTDLLYPSRVLIGSSDTLAGLAAASTLARLYAAWVPADRIVRTHTWSSELAKLVANAMLAQRISSINAVSAMCEKTGADVAEVARAVGLDPRVGDRFLNAGIGFGGSCFKKDVLSLCYLADSLGLSEVAAYWNSVLDINTWQCLRFVQRVIKCLNGSLAGKKIALFGYAFKKDTTDTRESMAIEVVRLLLRERPAEIAIFDPRCQPTAIRAELTAFFGAEGPVTQKDGGPVEAYRDPYTACEGASAVLILTEWEQFRYPPSPVVPQKRRGTVVDCSPQQQQPQTQSPQSHDDLMQQWLLRDERPCAESCVDCAEALAQQSSDLVNGADAAVDWERIAPLLLPPRWVFDGRSMVDPVALESIGFRVEAVGKASSRSRLRE